MARCDHAYPDSADQFLARLILDRSQNFHLKEELVGRLCQTPIDSRLTETAYN